ANEVEGVAEINLDVFAFGGVLDGVLTDQQRRAIDILLVNADASGRKVRAEAAVFVGGEFEIRADGGDSGLTIAGIVDRAIVTVPRIAGVVDVEGGGGNAGLAHELDLLG